MITKTELNTIISELDEKIKKYAVKFSGEKNVFETLTDNQAFFTYERTVAGFSTLMLSLLLGDKGYKVNLVVNEFPIELKNKLIMSEFDSLRSTTHLKTRTTQWDKCYVDSYIQVNDIVGSNETTQVFIEYKMENKLVLLNLASDYLKYKTYTYKSNEGTAFLYIIFKKEENYPSIISPSLPYYELIEYDIVSNPTNLEKRVYIYLPDKNGVTATEKDIENIYSRLNLISTLVDEVIDEIAKQKLSLGNEEKDLVDGMRFFNSKVLRSLTLKKYYPFMKEVWEKASSTDLFSNLDKIYNIEKEKITTKLIIEEGSTYKKNLSDIYTADAKQAAMEHGVNASANVSLFIVSICDFFNELFDIGVESPNYSAKQIRSGKKINVHQWSKTVDFFKSRLNEFYGKGEEGNRKIIKLYHSLMYYIMNLFPIIYEISDNNEITGYSKQFSDYRIIGYIQNELDKLIKLTKFKKTIDVDNILYDESQEDDAALRELIKYIFSKY